MWFWLSLLAAFLWGIDYALTGQVLKKLSLLTLLSVELFFGFLVTLLITVFTGIWKQDFGILFSSKILMVLVFIIMICFATANIMITASIQEKGASIASIIEISYPFFVALVTWIIFKERSFNVATVAGGLLIFVGVIMIYLSNR